MFARYGYVSVNKPVPPAHHSTSDHFEFADQGSMFTYLYVTLLFLINIHSGDPIYV